MVNCCVPGCTNYSSKSKSSGVSFHLIPKDPSRQKAWIARIRRENLPPLSNCYVCSEHFAPDCFKSDLRQKLTPWQPLKRRLKRDAVPSIFSFGPQPKQCSSTSTNVFSVIEPEANNSCDLGASDSPEALPTNYCKPETKDASTVSEDSTTDDEAIQIEPQEEKKYIVFKSCLISLLSKCLSCGETLIECEENTVGSLLSFNLFCINGHHTTWTSQPLIRNVPAGNLLLAASTLFSGNTYERISQFASFMNLEFIGKTSFYSLQKQYLFPVVDKAWKEEKSAVIAKAKKSGSLNVNGDGRCDSPGHNAKYGTYTMMADSGKIVTFNVVQSTEVSSSNAMEKEAFERCLSEVEKLVPVKRITTDRHVSIASAMKNKHPHIDHQY
ncbi:LOW QUALITY PROTEIN: THAP domain-containing protein 5-like, partial [Xenia sp. Carnegie-2017]|uniref:LOW QUALITY PROTEIN: THAP domain-containing protein 5-like n=1 Tax=Xenia sp. Carnegie-2017 TaxID=2897299 RepID=UPI001F034046